MALIYGLSVMREGASQWHSMVKLPLGKPEENTEKSRGRGGSQCIGTMCNQLWRRLRGCHMALMQGPKLPAAGKGQVMPPKQPRVGKWGGMGPSWRIL